MLLAIDVGNTNITFAVFDRDRLQTSWRVCTSVCNTADNYAAIFRENNIAYSDIDGVAISSVVPAVVDALVQFSKQYLNVDAPLVLSPEMDMGMKIHYNPISDLGADRIVNAIAAYTKYQDAVIVVDFGTATKLEAVSEDGEYLGGAIAPGIQISLDALFSKAAKLNSIELTAPDKAIGDSTAACLRSGIIFGFAGQVDALVERFQNEMGVRAKIVATGGLAGVIAGHSRTIKHYDDTLTVDGIRIIYDRLRG